MHACMRSDIRHHRTRDRPSPVIRSLSVSNSMGWITPGCFFDRAGGDRSDIRHHIRTTDGHAWTSHGPVMTRNESLMPRSHARAGTSRSCDPHTRTRYAHDALYDERIHAIRRFRQGFHQGQGHDDDAVRVVCVCVYVYACVGAFGARIWICDVRARAR